MGPYVLLGRLGAGGMGQVFLGRSPGGRLVAVKVIRAELAADPGFRVRFAREVAAARKVGGVFTAPVMDADPDALLPWLVTGFVDGPSLAQAVAGQGALPVASVLALAAGLAEGLGAVHAAGMVHRDLKPSNVLLAHDGPRVIDFGIAQAANATQMTGTGMAIGSPGFMSPEQAEGDPVGPASDVFSLGAVLVFAAAGKAPFGDGTAAAQLYRVVHGTPRLDGLPGPVRPLAERCLAKDPAQRPTAGQFLAELTTAHPAAANLTGWLPESILSLTPPLPAAPGHAADPAAAPAPGPGTRTQDPPGSLAPASSPDAAPPHLFAPHAAWPSTVTAAAHHDPPGPASTPERQAQAPHPDQDSTAARSRSAGLVRARPIPRRPRLRSWQLIAVVLAAAIIAAGALALTGGGGKQPAASLETVLRNPNPESQPFGMAFGPGAKTLIVGNITFSSHNGRNTQGGTTYLWDVATGRITAALTDPRTLGADSVALGPGGTLAIGDANGSTYLWNIATGKITATLTDPRGKGVDTVAFGPGGTTLATGDSYPYGSTYLWNIATAKITATLTDPRTEGVSQVAFGPGGTLAIGDANGSTYLWNIATGKITATLTDPRGKGVDTVAFGPGGALAIGDENGSTYLWNIATRKITDTLTDPRSKGVIVVAFGPGGILAVGDGNGSTYLWKIAA
jgi:serine/threonine protein kinase